MDSGTRIIYTHRFCKEFHSKLSGVYLEQQTYEECLRAPWLKLCDYHNKDDDISQM